MFQKYKEIIFGLAFGIGAVILDTAMDAIAAGNSLAAGGAEPPGMMVYRAVFIVFGLALGWVLWQRNRRERAYRQRAETLRKMQEELAKQTLLLRATLQNLLIRDDLHLSGAASQLMQEAYQEAQELQKIAEQKLPPP